MLQEILNQELTAIEPDLIKCEELDEVLAAGGAGCIDSTCAGTCGTISGDHT